MKSLKEGISGNCPSKVWKSESKTNKKTF